jgi:paraquat-inducible protein A
VAFYPNHQDLFAKGVMTSSPSRTDQPASPSLRGKEAPRIIACHECDLLHTIHPLGSDEKACCSRCGAFLYESVPNSLEKSLALNLGAVMLFLLANAYPFLSLKLSGNTEENLLSSGAFALQRLGMGELGLLVFSTSILFPFLTISGTLAILIPLKMGRRPGWLGPVFRMVKALTPWSLPAVFMLGVLISFVKLKDMATVIPGVSLLCFVFLVLLFAATTSRFDPGIIWPKGGLLPPGRRRGATALESGLLQCHTCSYLLPEEGLSPGKSHRCPRCTTPLHRRKSDSIERTLACCLGALVLLVPANIYPVMTVIQLGSGAPNTIISGIIHLIDSGMWTLALIVFFASFVVPILKLTVLGFLLLSIRMQSSWRPKDRTLLFRVTEVVGAWSMVDIYVVAILSALVRFEALANITPGLGAIFFAGVVVLTLFAAQSFDPRLIWDNRKERA